MSSRAYLLAACVLLSICVVAASQTSPNDKTLDLGELNKLALKIPMPAAPSAIYSQGGVVKVRVWINKRGDVIKAAVVSGPKPFRSAAVRSARGSKFPPNLGDCASCRSVTGVLVYTFVKQERAATKDE